jgi:hypothetical protein
MAARHLGAVIFWTPPNPAAFRTLRWRPRSGVYPASQSGRAPHPQGGALLLRPSSAPILFEAGYPGGRWGCAGPGRSMGPPLLHRMSGRIMVVAALGYTPAPPRLYRGSEPRLAPQLGGVRLSGLALLRLSTHLGRYVVAYPPGSFRLHRTLPAVPRRSPSDRP